MSEQDDVIHARVTLELAVRLGDLLLTAGMSANDVVVQMLRITHAYGLHRVHIDVTFTSICVTYYGSELAAPMSVLRTVQPDVIDFTKVRHAQVLVDRMQAGLPLADAVSDLQRIRAAAHPYPGWVATAANAAIGAGATLLFTVSWQIVVITFLTGCVVDQLLLWWDRRRVPPFFQQLLAAGLITLVATGVSYLGGHGVSVLAGLDPTLIVVGGIVLLVSGMTFVGAVQDAIDQFYVTATARMFEVAMRTGGIVVGIVGGLQFAVAIKHPIAVSTQPLALGPVAAQFVGAAVISAGFALWAYAKVLTVVLSGAMGIVGWAGYLGLVTLGVGEVPSNAGGALVAALIATLVARISRSPAFALIEAAVLPLVPGLSLYNGLLQGVGTSSAPGDLAASQSTLVLALEVGVAIAAGATLGTYVGRPFRDQLRRITDHARRRSPSGS